MDTKRFMLGFQVVVLIVLTLVVGFPLRLVYEIIGLLLWLIAWPLGDATAQLQLELTNTTKNT